MVQIRCLIQYTVYPNEIYATSSLPSFLQSSCLELHSRIEIIFNLRFITFTVLHCYTKYNFSRKTLLMMLIQ